MNSKSYPRICDNCKWFDKYPEDDTKANSSEIMIFHIGMLTDGDCRRYPDPYPKRKKDWCGEFAIMRDPRVEKVETKGEMT